jgi:putative transposase
MSPAGRRRAVERVVERLEVSERRACRVLGQHRSAQRYERCESNFSKAVTERTIELACDYGRYGYRRITELLRREGWQVNHKRVERIWRREGLKVPRRQPKRRRLWLNDGSCVRMRPSRPNEVWSYDFVEGATNDRRKYRMLTLVDEYTRECLALDCARKLGSDDVQARLESLFIGRGLPDFIRSDNGSEFTASAVKDWLKDLGVRTLFIEPGSPWENGYIESFNGKLRDELLNGEIFDTMTEARVLTERWRQEYNRFRPHSSLGYRPPAPEAVTDLAPEHWSRASYRMEPALGTTQSVDL